MKNNHDDQLNKGKSGNSPNQKPAQVGGKKENSNNTQPVKKAKTNVDSIQPEDMEEGTTLEEGKTGKKADKQGNKRGNL